MMSPQKSARRTGAQPATRTGRARKDKTRVLVPYKVPKRVEFRDSLPKSAVGKVLRRELVAGCK